MLHLKLGTSRPYHTRSGHTPNKGLPSRKLESIKPVGHLSIR